jgi:aldehyde dehydrogenase (NAD+)
MASLPLHSTAAPSHPFLDGKTKHMLIDGHWAEAASGNTFETINPATGQVIASIARGDRDDIDRAVSAARRAFDTGPWRTTKPAQRQALLLKFADLVEQRYDDLAMLDTLEMGMPLRTLQERRARIIGLLRWYAGAATTIHGDTVTNSLPGDILSFTLKEPIGVVGAITAWNGPLGATLWKIAPVLATGCTMVLKPAEEASLSALRLGELLLEIGLPSGVVNIVPGGGAAGAALVAHPQVDKIAMTGSVETGQKIVEASAGTLKRLSLELGGKSPNIVFADANLDVAVPTAAMAIFANSGQICAAGSRLFVERPVYEAFVERVAEFGRKLRIGNGLDPQTQLGPLVTERHLQRVTGYMDVGINEGAKLITGGARLTEGELAQGYFVPPTVFADVHDDMRIAREEIFGPVLSALPFDDIDEVVRRANDTQFGLVGSVWTGSMRKAQHMMRSLRAGTVYINCYGTVDPDMPFGGYKMSGYGRESGLEHLPDYLQTKAVYLNGL